MVDITQTGLIILELGSILVVGFLGARILKKIHIPQVLGFIVMGFIIGLPNRYIWRNGNVKNFITPDFYFWQFGGTSHVISYDFIGNITPILVTLALGIIGFNIGAELSWKELKKIDKKLFIVLLTDSIGTFLVVSLLTGIVTTTIYHDPIWWNFAFILGALGSATAPAATADVLWEYKSKGPLTQAVLFILAFDDIISIFLVQITTSITKGGLPEYHFSALQVFSEFALEAFAAIGIGIIAGIIITWAINRVKDHAEILELIIGGVVVIIGLTIYIHSSSILAAMCLGIMIATFTRSEQKTEAVFHDIFKIGTPIVSLFFIVVGFNINPADLQYIGLIGGIYLVGRTIGKVGFVNLTAKAMKCKPVISKYLGFTLFSQAGVALGLAVSIDETFQGTIYADHAHLIFTTITGTIVIVQLIGPILVRWAIHKAKEVGGKITQLEVAAALLADEAADKIIEKASVSGQENDINVEKKRKKVKITKLGDKISKLKSNLNKENLKNKKN